MNIPNKTLIFSLAIILGLFMTTNVTSLQPDQGPMMPGHMMGDRGFDGQSKNMNITGNIEISNNGITLSLDIKPTDAVINRVEARHPRMQIQDYQNEMNVTLYQLVEFTDISHNGYEPNDTILSTYNLNTTTLNPVVHTTVGTTDMYVITSKDNIFKMTVDVNVTNNIPHDWKWSIDLTNYPFVSNSSSIAMLHDITTTREGPHLHRDIRNTDLPRRAVYRFQNDTLMNTNCKVPMFFRWARSATVNGQTVNVQATGSPGFFALTIPQGNQISYDPQIGINLSTITQVDNYFSTFAKNFFETLLSPNSPGLIITISVIMVALVASYLVKNKNNKY